MCDIIYKVAETFDFKQYLVEIFQLIQEKENENDSTHSIGNWRHSKGFVLSGRTR
tara:strand:+ start:579 stop:743 length:165 start_codon:yes stop_codon:yes gene_type:complete